MNKNKIIIDIQYLPCVAYFALLTKFDEIIIDIGENYPKQTYRNRCKILTANGIHHLTVPVLKTGEKQATKEVQIDYSQKWFNNHWRTIASSYGKSPFFEYFAEEFYMIFTKKQKLLVELNLDLLTLCLKMLNIQTNLFISEKYIDLNNDNSLIDYRSLLTPQKPYHLIGFNDNLTYTQVFGMGFEPNLSVIDLLFCEGANAKNIIHQAII